MSYESEILMHEFAQRFARWARLNNEQPPSPSGWVVLSSYVHPHDPEFVLLPPLIVYPDGRASTDKHHPVTILRDWAIRVYGVDLAQLPDTRDER